MKADVLRFLRCNSWPRQTFLHSSTARLSSKSKRKITFEGSLGQHLTDIKTRHSEMTVQLMDSDNLEVSEITRIGKDIAELSRVVVLIDERRKLLQEVDELLAIEKEELSR